MIQTENRGHSILSEDGEQWCYEDGTILTPETERPCIKCGIAVGWDDPDPCLGTLPGCVGACCGHGNSEFEFVKTDKGIRYDSVEAWRLDTDCGTLRATTH